MVAAAIATYLLCGGEYIREELVLRTQTRTLPDGAGDLQLDPVVALETPPGALQLGARYLPTLLLREPRERTTFSLLHRGTLAGTLRLSKDQRLRAEERLVSGSTDISWLGFPPDAPPPLVIRTFRSLPIGVFESSSSTSFEQAIRQHIHLSATARYSVSGGVSGEDRLTLPRVRTAALGATGAWTGGRETFSLAITGAKGWVSTGTRTTFLGASSGWRHSFARGLDSEVAAGLSVLGGSAGETHGVVPTGSVSLRRETPTTRGALGGQILLRWAPGFDATTGLLRQRAEGSARLEFAPVRRLLLSAMGGVGVTPDVPPPEARVLTQGAMGVAYTLSPAFALSVGVRVVTLPGVEWAGVVGTTFSEQGGFRLP